MVIERATLCDADEILALQKTAYISEAEIYDDFNIQPLLQTLDELKKEMNEQVVLKAVTGGKICGSVRAFEKAGTCHIGKLMVHPDFQNKGLGAGLLKEIENVFGSSKRFELFTGHRSLKNQYLYQKVGYTIFQSKTVTDKLSMVYLEKMK